MAKRSSCHVTRTEMGHWPWTSSALGRDGLEAGFS